MLMHALAASCEELRARTGNPPLSGRNKNFLVTKKLQLLAATFIPSENILSIYSRTLISLVTDAALRLQPYMQGKWIKICIFERFPKTACNRGRFS